VQPPDGAVTWEETTPAGGQKVSLLLDVAAFAAQHNNPEENHGERCANDLNHVHFLFLSLSR
jgi:hypothetical protein